MSFAGWAPPDIEYCPRKNKVNEGSDFSSDSDSEDDTEMSSDDTRGRGRPSGDGGKFREKT